MSYLTPLALEGRWLWKSVYALHGDTGYLGFCWSTAMFEFQCIFPIGKLEHSC